MQQELEIEVLIRNVWKNLYETYKDVIPSNFSHDVSVMKFVSLPYQKITPLLMHPVFEEFLKVSTVF